VNTSFSTSVFCSRNRKGVFVVFRKASLSSAFGAKVLAVKVVRSSYLERGTEFCLLVGSSGVRRFSASYLRLRGGGIWLGSNCAENFL
jgi:hypothetical protein